MRYILERKSTVLFTLTILGISGILFYSALDPIHSPTSQILTVNTGDTKTKYDVPNKPSDMLSITIKTPKGEKNYQIPVDKLLFDVSPKYDQNGHLRSMTMKLKPDLSSLYHTIGYPSKSQKVVYVYPIFTQAAYGENGFYDYYKKKCDTSCLTISIPDRIRGSYSSSIAAALVLTLLNYSSINDIDIDKNPDILKKYDKVIVLHNEYVTQKEFDAITHHPNVIYLYSNSLYAQVQTDYDKNTITLVRGHGYPEKSIKNGFDWQYDHSRHEYNVNCDTWGFYNFKNGKMLNCYPEYRVLYDEYLLKTIKDS